MLEKTVKESLAIYDFMNLLFSEEFQIGVMQDDQDDVKPKAGDS